MAFTLFAIRNRWHKNGIWWFSKIFNGLMGQKFYDSLRVQRRTLSNRFYYIRQQMLYRTYIQSPNIANMIGIYPKTDTSHGYGNTVSYEMYKDFQENSINGDGSFGMWLAVIGAVYTLHEVYGYFLPFYWNKTAACKNGDEQRVRMRDALNSTTVEESYGYQFLEWAYSPHQFHYVRHKLLPGHSHPDDIRAMACSSLIGKNRYIQHYKHFESRRMEGFF